MKLFKKKEEKTCCACNGDAIAEAEKLKTDKGIKILGSGCAKCQALENAVRAAVEELSLDSSIQHVSDFAQIASYGVMSTPALVIDGKVVSYGKVLSIAEVKSLLTLTAAE